MVVFSDQQRRFEDACLDCLNFYSRREIRGESFVGFLEGGV